MPFIKWRVEPVNLCRAPLFTDKNAKNELQDVANTTLVEVLRQLACLVRVAANVFSEIGTECKLVYHRTENLKDKVEACEKLVLSLNAKTALVPVGDLSQFSQVNEHYQTSYHLDTRLFVCNTRPACVEDGYQQANANPIPVIRSIDQLRSDGCTGSRLFMCMPVFEDAKAKEVNLEIETRRPASFCVSREWQGYEDTGYQIDYDGLLSDDESTIYSDGVNDQLRLPSPEERMLALSMEYPSTVVPIDVSGSTLTRMANFRRSLIHVDFFIRRKKKKKDKRRNTISEGDSKELQEVLRKANIATACPSERVRSPKSCQTTSDVCQTTKEVQPQKLFSSHQKNKLEENNNCSTDPQLPKKNETGSNGLYETVDLKVSKEWKPGKKEKCSKNTQCSTPNKKQGSEPTNSKKTVGKSKGRSYIPISTLSAAMTVAVKMRQAFTGNKTEDVQSSSGNWSASSSQRTSMDSDPQHSVSSPARVHSPSESSLSKDSVLSDSTQQDTDARSQDGTMTDCASETSAATAPVTLQSRWRPSSLVAKQFTAMDTETWLQSVEKQSPEQSEDDQSNSTSSLQTHFSNTDCRTSLAQNSHDDEDSSIFSVDADGYYTSMHTDSGLKGKHGYKLYDSSDEDDDTYGMGLRQGSDTSISTIGNSSLNSLLSRTATELSSSSSTLTQTKKIPPPPPPRVSSIKPKQEEGNLNNQMKNEYQVPQLSLSPKKVPAQETENLQKKTTINSINYPSLCPITPAPSDDEITKHNNEQKGTKVKLINMINKKHHGKFSKENFQNELLCKINKYESTGARQNTLVFNMYSDQSPQKTKFPLTFQERESPVLREKKSCMTSFLPTNQNENSKETPFLSISFLPKGPENSVKSQLITGSKATASSPEGLNTMKSTLPRDVSRSGSLPLKYAHHITVTPISRDSKNKNSLIYSSPTFCGNSSLEKKTVPLEPGIPSVLEPEKSQNICSSITEKSQQICHIPPAPSPLPSCSEGQSSNTSAYLKDTSTEVPPSSVHKIPSRPLRPTTLVPASANRPVARVTLDPNGQVIFSSNSLGRRRDGHPVNYHHPSHARMSCQQKFATLPLRQNPIPNTISPISPLSSNTKLNSTCTIPLYAKSTVNHPLPSSLPISPPPTPITSHQREFLAIERSPYYQNIDQLTNLAGNFQRTSIANIPGNSSPVCVQTSSLGSQMPTYAPPSIDQNLLKTSSCMHSSLPLTKQNIGFHSQRLNNFSTAQQPHYCVTDISPKSFPVKTSYSGSQLSNSSGNQEIKRKSMTTEDLFAVIHSSKKRLNIKTDSDISASPLSSRSSSPSSVSSSVSKSGLAETGFLSPRNTNQGTPRDRRSWSGDTKSYSMTPGERRSLACDRFGPSKPTSMHEFKLLLLQTRSSSQNTGPRKSAMEQLMETAPQVRKIDYSVSTSSSPVTHSTPCSPTSATDSSLYNGHSTVPLKRGCRARTSLQSRYVLYPPIWEDLSEDSETGHDFQHNLKIKSSHPLETGGAYSQSSNHHSHVYHQMSEPSMPTEKKDSGQHSGNGAGSSTWV